MVKISDQHIIGLIQHGDINTFNRLFDQHYTSLCYYATRYIADFDTARSLVQEVFIDLWIKRERIIIKHSLKSYLYKSVKNRTTDYFRRRKDITDLSISIEEAWSTNQRDLIEEAELSTRINQAFNRLPDKCREIFLLCKFDGMKYIEIADKLDISVKTVEMQMSIALKKLRDSLYDLKMINLVAIIHRKLHKLL